MYKPSDSYYKEFTTASPTTGAATNADSLPSATANHNGTDDGGFALTVSNVNTGKYLVTGTVPSGYVRGAVVNISVSATVGGVLGKAVIDTFVVDSKRIGDLNDSAYAGGAVASVTGSVGSVAGNVTGSVGSVVGAVGSVTSSVNLNMTQAVPLSNTAHTVGDALNAARAQGFGKWVLSGTTLTLYASDGTTQVHAFTLDSSSSPTQRV